MLEPGPVAYVILGVLLAALVAYAIWAWRIRKAIGEPPTDRAGQETERFRFKYGPQPPGGFGPGSGPLP
jgi:hypothetical protein